MKILAVCQSGLGSSFMVQMNIQNALKQAGVDISNIEVGHSDVGSCSADSADYFFLDATLDSAMGSIPKEKLVLLKSLIDPKETQTKVNQILDKEKITHN